MGERTYHFKIGQIDCTAVSDGHFVYAPPIFPPPVDFLFANAPPDRLREVLREVGADLETAGEWMGPYTCLLIRTGGNQVLVDTGAGGLGPAYRAAAGELGAGRSRSRRHRCGHSHPCSSRSSRRQHRPAGRSHAFRRQNGSSQNESGPFGPKEKRNSELPEHGKDVLLGFARRNLSVLKDRVRLVKGEEEILPGIRIIPAPGHTPGQIAVSVSSEGQSLYCLSDVVLHPAHMREPEWMAVVDMLPTQLVATRRSLLEKAATEEALVMVFHFPFPGLGRVLPEADGWQWKPLG